jgi:hypothetical protein
MALTRPLKEGSVTTYQQKVALGFPDILASEMDADLDTIYAAWNGGVGTSNLIDSSVTSAKLAVGAVGTRELADLLPGSILADGQIGTRELADLGVTTAKLVDASVTTAKLANPVYARVYRDTGMQSIVTATNTALTFDKVYTNVGGAYSAGAPDRFTIPLTSGYVCGASASIDRYSAGTRRALSLYVNGVAIAGTEIGVNLSFLSIVAWFYATATNTVQAVVVHDAGTNLGMNVTSFVQNFWIARVW